MTRKIKDYVLIGLKGMAMGAADVVPGVSGGTIAFISGIYEELIDSIQSINPSRLNDLREGGVKKAWKEINGNFLLSLFTGIFVSVFSLSRILSELLETQPILVWSFFFGLVLASIFFVLRAVNRWDFWMVLLFVLGAVVAYLITNLPVYEGVNSLPFLFLSGALAVCAMILPGISGSFILVLLGSYKAVLDAVHERKLLDIAVVGLGAVIGLLSFARLLKWLFSRFHNGTLAVLSGFILGSLGKIWPWKKVVETRIFEDKVIPVKEWNQWPGQYEGDPQILGACLLAFLGFSLIFILERLARKN